MRLLWMGFFICKIQCFLEIVSLWAKCPEIKVQVIWKQNNVNHYWWYIPCMWKQLMCKLVQIHPGIYIIMFLAERRNCVPNEHYVFLADAVFLPLLLFHVACELQMSFLFLRQHILGMLSIWNWRLLALEMSNCWQAPATLLNSCFL